MCILGYLCTCPTCNKLSQFLFQLGLINTQDTNSRLKPYLANLIGKITLLDNSFWVILATHLNCSHSPLPTHVCISHAVKHTHRHTPLCILCILAAACDFEGSYVHLLISHSIDNLYPCRRGHRKKNQ